METEIQQRVSCNSINNLAYNGKRLTSHYNNNNGSTTFKTGKSSGTNITDNINNSSNSNSNNTSTISYQTHRMPCSQAIGSTNGTSNSTLSLLSSSTSSSVSSSSSSGPTSTITSNSLSFNTSLHCNSVASSNNKMPECFGCHKVIREKFLLKALDQLWHEDCLRCACCDCRLGEVGSTLFTKANLILCKRDYLRLFGTTGLCSACNKTIPAFEMVMRAKGHNYHLECFQCSQCNHRFCVGDRFYLLENKILCEYDYEERMVFASLPPNVSSLVTDHIKRQTTEVILGGETGAGSDAGSSGYGSSESPYTEQR